jgi:hypothetical protein
MPSKHVFNNAVSKAIEYTMLATRKSTCCEPYDCMHHELCGEEWYGSCGLCVDIEAAYNELMRYARKRNVNLHKVWIAENEWTEQDRLEYYRHTRYNDNAPSHWSDGGKYE